MTPRPVDYAAFDEVVVYRLVAGQPVGTPVRVAESAEAVRRLAALGYSDGQAAARLGCTRRAVWRIRAKRGIVAALKPGDNAHTRLHRAPSRPKLAG